MTHQPTAFWRTPALVGSLLCVLVVMILASIHPLSWSDYLLHQAGTVLCIIVLLWLRRPRQASHSQNHQISTVSFILAMLFLLIHIIGARYLYSYVPYSEWTQALFGFNLDTMMGWQRNMYDRLVHFSYGLLLTGVFYDVLKSYFPYSTFKQLAVLVLMVNMSSSMLYELFEWLLAIGLSPEAAEAYNGQQGDMWDAHKDMALALFGGMIALAFMSVRRLYHYSENTA